MPMPTDRLLLALSLIALCASAAPAPVGKPDYVPPGRVRP
jgi:hypothetical protein